MPQALTAFLIKLGVSALAAQLITAAVTIGFTVLLNSIFGPSRPKPSDGQQTTRVSLGSRYRDYGIVHSGGQMSFLESKNGTLAQVVTLATGEQSEITQHRINDKVVTVVGGTVTEASFHGALHIYTRPGTDDQTAIGELTAKFPEWTSDHRQLGCPHAAIILDPVKQEQFSEVTNGQMPQYSQVRKGVKLYDPRLDDTAVIGFDEAGDPIMGSGPQRLANRATWGWADNGALVIADYFANEDGYGCGYDNVNWTNIAREAVHCDAAELTVTGETIARWRIWARYALATEERRQILTDMLKAVDGFCWQDADGKFNLMTGRFEEPDITLTDDHIASMSATLGAKAQQRVNALKVLYTEAAIGYREQESATISNPEFAGDPQSDAQAVQAYYVPHHNQAMRIGKPLFLQLGDRWHITAQVNLYGLNLIGRRFTRLSSARLGVTAYFKIERLRLNLAACTVEAELAEVRPEDWAFDAATEEGTPPVSSDTSAPVPPLAAPTGLVLAAVQISLGQTNGVAISASWADPARPDRTWEAMLRPTAGGDWVAIAVDNDARTATSGTVNSGTQYDVRVRARTISGRSSAWTTGTITPTATVTLAAPTNLTAVGAAGQATVGWRNPTSPTLGFVRVYRNTVNNFGAATLVGGNWVGGLGEMMSVPDTGLSAGTKYYWVRAFDGVGGQSTVTGPATATVS
jgi:hypothetical protein